MAEVVIHKPFALDRRDGHGRHRWLLLQEAAPAWRIPSRLAWQRYAVECVC